MKAITMDSRAGVTLLEVLIAAGLLLVLASLIMPLFDTLVGTARSSGCAGNLRQIHAGCSAYQGDHRNQWPENRTSPGISFAKALEDYLGPYPLAPRADESFRMARGILVCPADRYGTEKEGLPENVYAIGNPRHGLSYGQNGFLDSTNSSYGAGSPSIIAMPSRLSLYMDWEGHYIANSQTLMTDDGKRKKALMKRHGGKINIIFADGHVESVLIENIPNHVPAPVPFWTGRETGSKP